jgi:hypothetical protein
MGFNNPANQVLNVTAQVTKPCPMVPPVIVSYVYGAPLGWNAVLVGLLSCLLALIVLLTCLYYLTCRRYLNETSDCPPPVVLVDKAAAAAIPVTCTSQTATTTFINEPGKETKVTTYNEQATGPMPAGDFVLGMPSVSNGHTNGLLVNGNTDPSELRLLQHEHH